MDYAIGKLSTGIERSGTGIERSGTGIERSGTGSRFKRAALSLCAAIALASSFSISAKEPQLLVSRGADSVLVSVHSGRSILVGSMALQGGVGDYISVNLYQATSQSSSNTQNSELLFQGSGGGTPGSACNPGDSGLKFQGSGGGSSSDGESYCTNKIAPWGTAELVFDPSGTSIIIHRNGPAGPEEFMVEFIAGTQSVTADAYSLPGDSQTEPRRVVLH